MSLKGLAVLAGLNYSEGIMKRRGSYRSTRHRSTSGLFASSRITSPESRILRLEPLEDRTLLAVLAGSSEDLTDFPSPAAEFLAGTLELTSYASDEISGRLSVPAIDLTTVVANEMEFSRLSVPDWGVGGQIGQAELPVFRTSFAIPEGVGLEATYDVLASTSLGEGVELFPVQPPAPAVTLADGTRPEVQFAYDTTYYESELPSETAIFVASDPLIAGKACSVAIEFSPFQYNALSGAVSVVTDLAFHISFEESSSTESSAPVSPDLTSQAALADYLIIAADDFYEEVLPLAEWKHKKGYKTYVAKMSDVGTTDTDVYNYIKTAYDADADKPEYVLLVGDHENVPSYEISGHPSSAYTAPHIWHTDYEYAKLAGSDNLADVALGRLPGDTESQITLMVNKILDYERTPDMGTWYDDVLIAGMFQDSDDSNLIADRWFMEDIHRVSDFLGGDYDFWSGDDPYDQGYTVHTNRVWDSATTNTLHYQAGAYPGRITPPDPIPTAWKNKPDEGISATINSGTSFVLHRDHGYLGGSGWADPQFVTSDVYALSNGDKLPIVFSLEL